MAKRVQIYLSVESHKTKKGADFSTPHCFVYLAEREGFEPPEPLSSTVFKTAAIDHSAIFPPQK